VGRYVTKGCLSRRGEDQKTSVELLYPHLPLFFYFFFFFFQAAPICAPEPEAV
jgi:hypothetical protein